MASQHSNNQTNDQKYVTAVISHLVRPNKQPQYEQWLRDISAVAQQFEGHSGVSFVRPHDPSYPEYAVILKFDGYQNLKRWIDSSARRKWMEKAQQLIQKDESVQILTGFETWFTLPGKLAKQPPKRYKMAVLTSLAVFAVAQIFGYVIGPLLQSIPGLLRSLILTSLTVFALTYVVMPRVTRLFYRWLYPKAAADS